MAFPSAAERCFFTLRSSLFTSFTPFRLSISERTEVTVDALLASKAISKAGDGVKILGNGELTKKLTVKVNAVSETAKAKIEAAGGTVEVI